MDLVITPEPHFIPGYTGHCQEARFRQGKTYGKLSHKLLIDPSTKHAPELIVTPPTQPQLKDYPTAKEINALQKRMKFVDAVYRHPIIPGYEGLIPNMANKIGKRFIAATTAGLAEHENLMEWLRCERHLLEHRDLLESGTGRFDAKLRERMIPQTKYRSPLIPVKPRGQALKLDKVKVEKEPYTKFSQPFFMENDNEEKYIKNGYTGHIPTAVIRFGQCHKELTHSALCHFTNDYRHRKNDKWCPTELTAEVGHNDGQFIIYHQKTGMNPLYAGHVPGELFSFGRTFGNSSVSARDYLAFHKEQQNYLY